MIHMSDLEIISTYNSELRGICNYYNLASNYCQLRYFAYLMEYSCLKTLAAKHNTKISKIIAKFKDGKGGWGIPYETKSGKNAVILLNTLIAKTQKMVRTISQTQP